MAPFANSTPPMYHVVPRFDIAAKGGALELGTVVDDLLLLRPLNRGTVLAIPEVLRYPPVTHRNFTERWSQSRERHGSIWANAYMVRIGVSAAASHDEDPMVVCDAVVTMYFDPDEKYVHDSLDMPCIQQYFLGTDYEKDVYMVTGLKVAKKLRYIKTSSSQHQTEAGAHVQEPTSGTQLGADVGVTGNAAHSVDFEVDDIVVGFRVRRYAYVRSSWNPRDKSRKPEGGDHLNGAQLYGNNSEDDPEVFYENRPIQEEQKAQIEAEAKLDTLDEIWIGGTSLS